MRAFKRTVKSQDAAANADAKPILFIYQEAFMLSITNNIFTEVLQEYADVFDLFICDDASEITERIYLKDTHP